MDCRTERKIRSVFCASSHAFASLSKFIEIFKCVVVFAEVRLREGMDFIENFAQMSFFAEFISHREGSAPTGADPN